MKLFILINFLFFTHNLFASDIYERIESCRTESGSDCVLNILVELAAQGGAGADTYTGEAALYYSASDCVNDTDKRVVFSVSKAKALSLNNCMLALPSTDLDSSYQVRYLGADGTFGACKRLSQSSYEPSNSSEEKRAYCVYVLNTAGV